MMTTDSHDQAVPILTFLLAKQRYAFLVADVIEVVAMVNLMSVKDAPAEILGMVNRHGMVIPVLDLRLVMGHQAGSITPATLFVIIQYGEQTIGAVVDEVQQVEYIDADQLQKSTKPGKYIRGIISYRDELMQIVNPEPLITQYVSDIAEG